MDKISITSHQNFHNYVVCKLTARYTCGNTEMDLTLKTIQLQRNQFINRMGVRLTCFTLTDTKNRQNWHFKQLNFLSSFIKINNTIRCPCQFQNLFHCCCSLFFFFFFYPLPFFLSIVFGNSLFVIFWKCSTDFY